MKAYKGFNKDMTCSPNGEKIKPDTWYKLENGEFVEVEYET
jgi:hypothetical protein